jgi:hypothetical protein
MTRTIKRELLRWHLGDREGNMKRQDHNAVLNTGDVGSRAATVKSRIIHHLYASKNDGGTLG